MWVEKGKLAGSGYPASKSQVEWLVRSGIGSILTLTVEPLPSQFTVGLGLTIGHVGMQDHDPPGLDAMARAVDFIVQERGAGRTVLVHCLAGEGRTGCVLAAYLIRARRMGADEAMAEIRRAKGQFVESRQESAVREFAARELAR